MTDPSPSDPDASGDILPDRLCADPTSPYYDAASLERGVGVRFKGVEKTNVEEYCVSEQWVRLSVGNTMARNGTVPADLAATVCSIVNGMKTSAKLTGLGTLVERLMRENPKDWRNKRRSRPSIRKASRRASPTRQLAGTATTSSTSAVLQSECPL